MPWTIFCNRTYRRLARIYKYCKTFYNDTKRTAKAATVYTIEFHSKLGDVKVDIYAYHNQLDEGKLMLSYANYAGSTVFEITAECDSFNVVPMLSEDLSGHDVDLAILELETYLLEKYGDIDAYLAQKDAEERERVLRHKKELRILENGR